MAWHEILAWGIIVATFAVAATWCIKRIFCNKSKCEGCDKNCKFNRANSRKRCFEKSNSQKRNQYRCQYSRGSLCRKP